VCTSQTDHPKQAESGPVETYQKYISLLLDYRKIKKSIKKFIVTVYNLFCYLPGHSEALSSSVVGDPEKECPTQSSVEHSAEGSGYRNLQKNKTIQRVSFDVHIQLLNKCSHIKKKNCYLPVSVDSLARIPRHD
jgi:hypothetical protein